MSTPGPVSVVNTTNLYRYFTIVSQKSHGITGYWDSIKGAQTEATQLAHRNPGSKYWVVEVHEELVQPEPNVVITALLARP